MELELADPADDPARPLALGGAMRLRPGPPPIAKRDRRSGGSRAKSRRSVATAERRSFRPAGTRIGHYERVLPMLVEPAR